MLWIIWLIFAVLFLGLAYYHWVVSRVTISPLKITIRPLNQPDSPIRATITVAGADIDQPLKDFAGDFNNYLVAYNKSSRKQNIFQACGYLLASLTAIFSILFSM